MSDGGKENKKKSVEEELFRFYTNFEAKTSEKTGFHLSKDDADDDIFDAEDSFDLCEDRSGVSESSSDFKGSLSADKSRLFFAEKYNQIDKENENIENDQKSSETICEDGSERNQPEASEKRDNASERYSGTGRQDEKVFNAELDTLSDETKAVSSKQKSVYNAEKKSGFSPSGNKKAFKRILNEKFEKKYSKNSAVGKDNIQEDKKTDTLVKGKKSRFAGRIINNFSRSKSSEKLLSDSPYITAGKTPGNIYTDFIIAAVPLLIWAVYLYGFRVLLVSLVSVLSCVCFELWFEYLIHRRVTVQNMSAAKEGLLLSLLFPAAVPLWIPVVAAFFGTVVIKEIFGGIGKNLLNPSLAGFALVSIVFRESVAVFTAPYSRLSLLATEEMISGISGVYPLSAICGRSLPSGSYAEMILGQRVGSIGEVSAVLICAGLIYLIVRCVISWQVPVSFLAVTILLYFIFPRHLLSYRFTITEMLCSMIPLCAVYFAPDFSTVPLFKSGKILFGFGCGVLTVIFRYVGVGIYSTVYAILIMNLTARPIDLYVIPFLTRIFHNVFEGYGKIP